MQLNLLELLLSQSTPSGGPFGMDRFSEPAGPVSSCTQAPPLGPADNHTILVDWLSASMSAARSLFGAILTLPPDEEGTMSNVEWIAIQCALSLALRLDLFATYGHASEATRHLSRFLDIRHTLRQTVMRLESIVRRYATAADSDTGADIDAAGGKDGFRHLAQQARRLESWYLAQSDRARRLSVSKGDERSRGDEASRTSGHVPDARPQTMEQSNSLDLDSTMTGIISPATSSETWNVADLAWDGRDLQMGSMGDFLFADFLNFPPLSGQDPQAEGG